MGGEQKEKGGWGAERQTCGGGGGEKNREGEVAQRERERENMGVTEVDSWGGGGGGIADLEGRHYRNKSTGSIFGRNYAYPTLGPSLLTCRQQLAALQNSDFLHLSSPLI